MMLFFLQLLLLIPLLGCKKKNLRIKDGAKRKKGELKKPDRTEVAQQASFTKSNSVGGKKEGPASGGNKPTKQKNPAVDPDGYLKSEEIDEKSEWDEPLEPMPQGGGRAGRKKSQRKDLSKEKSKMGKEKSFVRSVALTAK